METNIVTLENYLQQNYTTQTAKAYQRDIQLFLINNPNAQAYTYVHISAYVGLLRKQYSNAKTIHRIVASIKVYYNYLCASGQRLTNPSKALQLRDTTPRAIQLQDLLTDAQLQQLLTAKQERYSNLKNRNDVLISLLVYQALTPTEMAAIMIADISLEQATIYIKQTPKTNRRTLPLNAKQILIFKNYLDKINSKTNKLLVSLQGEPMQAEDITKHIKRNYKLPNIIKINCQIIRQSVITNLLLRNNDLRIVQSFAGHKTPSTTAQYQQTNVALLQAALNKHHPIQ